MGQFMASVGVFSGLILAVLFAGGVGAAELKLGGTGGDLGTMRKIAEAYMAQNPGTEVTVYPSLGSGGGIRAVIAGTLDLSISSRPLKDKERAVGVADFAYAKTALVVATVGEQELEDLTLRRLVDIYAKRDATWPNGRRIRLVLRPMNDGDTKLLEDQIEGMAKAFRAADKPGATIGRTDQDAADALERRPDSIGFSSLSLILGENRLLRSLPLNGVAPTVEALAAGRYPLSKTFYMVTKAAMSAGTRRFIDFIQSPVGRDILRRTGHVPSG